MALSGLIGNLVGPVAQLVDKFVPDADAASKFKNELQLALLQQSIAEQEKQVEVIVAEAKGESWLQRNWRPMLMTMCTAICANNYILAPYLNLIFGTHVMLDLPERLWDLMTLGVGGYTVGRSTEKCLAIWKKG